MSVESWLKMAQADAAARGLDPVVPLLDGLAVAVRVLRGDQDVEEVPAVATGAPTPADTATAMPVPIDGPGMLGLAAQVARGEIKSERLTEDCLEHIRQRQPELNAFITVTADEALAEARQADREIAAGRVRGPLHGMPLSLKDLIDVAGVATTAGSNVRRNHVAVTDAVATARLRAAGAVLIGKTNLHEFAFGTTSDDSAWGPARNPADPTRSPGGSSGGSAISVATAMALGSVGTDTGGSVRIPSAACGIVGLKPEWGEISAVGVVPLSRQLDHLGPMTRTVSDAWLMYDVMRGAGTGTGFAPTATSMGRLRIGVPTGYLYERLDPQVDAAVRETLARLRAAGASVGDVTIPHVTQTPHVYLALVLADGAAYHARTLESQPDDYTHNVRFRFEMGRYVMAEDYVRAQTLRARLAREVDAALAGVDVLALPTLGIPAPPIGAATVPVMGGDEPVRAAMLRCTQLFNMTGHPAIALPCGLTREGLPVSLQLVGRKGGTARLLAHALGVERLLLGRA
jgi:aspartyl-tRNA(Asn)/glutamyl-tRNA(Gln) amidotransferase subunit A